MPMRSTEGPTGAVLASIVAWEASYGQVEVSGMLAAVLAMLAIMSAPTHRGDAASRPPRRGNARRENLLQELARLGAKTHGRRMAEYYI